uniref:GTPase obg n=1 Tax=Lygus hesperus TaxID=30085 RepID=A0A0A9WIZ9_LYGHE
MQAGERVLVAAGGAGGPGNAAVCRSKQRTLEAVNVGGATPSYETVELQLRLLADVGVVGFPNAGKSTLVSTISHANPKVACYPFTTLTPSVGTVPICRNAIATDAFTIADIPGIVVGSSNSCGLGSNFLRHIELTKVLLYLIDIAKIISQGDDDPVQTFLALREELSKYNPALLERPSVVFLNKIDVRPVACASNIERMRNVVPPSIPVFAGSCQTGVGIPTLLHTLYHHVNSCTRGSLNRTAG